MTSVRPESAPGADARPTRAANVVPPTPSAADTYRRDRLLVAPGPATLEPLDGTEGVVKKEEERGFIYNLFFGNTENKLFQIKFNLIHFKDVALGFVTWAQTGPFGPLFTLIDKVGHAVSAGLARLQGRAASALVAGAEASKFERALAWFGKAAGPIRGTLGFSMKFLEKSAPFFGWLVAVQDLVTATKLQEDDKTATTRKALTWATFVLSAVGATASTLAAWSAAGAVVTSATGVGLAGFGAIAIGCFCLSLLTGWLSKRGVAATERQIAATTASA